MSPILSIEIYEKFEIKPSILNLSKTCNTNFVIEGGPKDHLVNYDI